MKSLPLFGVSAVLLAVLVSTGCYYPSTDYAFDPAYPERGGWDGNGRFINPTRQSNQQVYGYPQQRNSYPQRRGYGSYPLAPGEKTWAEKSPRERKEQNDRLAGLIGRSAPLIAAGSRSSAGESRTVHCRYCGGEVDRYDGSYGDGYHGLCQKAAVTGQY